MIMFRTNNTHFTSKFRLTPVALLIFATFPVWATDAVKTDSATNEGSNSSETVEFETNALRLEDIKNIDISRFSRGSSAMAGIYQVNIVVNGNQIAYEQVEFKEQESKSVYACLTPRLIGLINFNWDQLSPEAKKKLESNSVCPSLEKIIPNAKVTFDSNDQQLNISIPQIYVNRISSGTVSPELWDSGIPAGMLSYYLNGYDSKYSNSTSRSFYAGLNSGVNIGAWYLRHNGSYSWMQDQGGKYSSINTYIQRDVTPLRGRVTLGQTNTRGQIFDSLPFSGGQFVTDDSMLPDSQRGYAPEIRGVAKTNAKVTVKQQGQVIYETTVSPGAFLINDLYPTGYGGALEISIQEADGTVQNYTQPYAAVAQLLRPGTHYLSLTAGQLRDTSISDKPMLYEGTYQLGISNSVTAYGGVQASQNYKAFQLGSAVGTLAGAFSLDITQSYSQLGGNTSSDSFMSGQSYKASYSKLITETDSNITLAAYRFSSSGYMDYLTTMQTRQSVKDNNGADVISRSKNRFTLSASQGLAEGWGSFYASATLENYWNERDYNKQYQLGYSNSYGRLTYSLNVNKSQSAYGVEQTSYSLNFSFPLWENRDIRAPIVSTRYNQDSQGGKGEQVTIAGAAGEDNKYTYNLSGAHDNNSGSSGGIAGTWMGSASNVNGSYNKGQGYQTTSLGMSGAVVVHLGGVTLSPYASDTFALIEAKGAEGAKVGSFAGSRIDSKGYALFPSLRPYQFNEVSIDPEGSGSNVEFENTSQKVVPRSGAVVKAYFKTRTGIPLLISSTYNGQPVPFGAEVFDELNKYVGAVSQGGVIYAKVPKLKGFLLVKWGDDSNLQCKLIYTLPTKSTDKNIKLIPQKLESECK